MKIVENFLIYINNFVLLLIIYLILEQRFDELKKLKINFLLSFILNVLHHYNEFKFLLKYESGHSSKIPVNSLSELSC